jgi:hypothetical protein
MYQFQFPLRQHIEKVVNRKGERNIFGKLVTHIRISDHGRCKHLLDTIHVTATVKLSTVNGVSVRG